MIKRIILLLHTLCAFSLLPASLHIIEDEVSLCYQGSEVCFILYNLSEERHIVTYNQHLSKIGVSPCSTFKIANTLIGLEEKILEDENTVFLWDGSPQPFSCWESDHTLSSAVRFSVVWYFQALAGFHVQHNIGND